MIEARNSSPLSANGEQRGPGLDEMVATGHVLHAIERSSRSGAWEVAREPGVAGTAR